MQCSAVQYIVVTVVYGTASLSMLIVLYIHVEVGWEKHLSLSQCNLGGLKSCQSHVRLLEGVCIAKYGHPHCPSHKIIQNVQEMNFYWLSHSGTAIGFVLAPVLSYLFCDKGQCHYGSVV